MAVSTGTALAGAAILGTGASLLSSNQAAGAQKSAAQAAGQASASAADRAGMLNEPWRLAGTSALNSLTNLAGLNGPEAAQSTLGQFTTSPGYQFRMNEGMRAIEASAAARGGALSGNALMALQERGQGLASAEYGNWMNQLAALSNTGQASANNTATAGINAANQTGAAALAAGQASATGAIQTGNAINSGLNSLAQIYGKYGSGSNSIYGDKPPVGNGGYF